MRDYEQMCGLAIAMDILGERWTVLIIRELILGPQRFGQLRQSLLGLTPNVLSKRLAHLEDAGVITRHPAGGYVLSDRGRQLVPALQQLSRWGSQLLPSKTVQHYRRQVRWLMTSLCWRLQPLGKPWELVLKLEDQSYSLWERNGACHVSDGAVPSFEHQVTLTDEELRQLVFAPKLPATAPGVQSALLPLYEALHAGPRDTKDARATEPY